MFDSTKSNIDVEDYSFNDLVYVKCAPTTLVDSEKTFSM